MTRTAPPDPGAAPTPTGAAPPQDAVIFDMDGVVTDTAAVHAAAWKRLFDAVLADDRTDKATPQRPFDFDSDYRRYVDGRSREDGVGAFLAARGIDVPLGAAGDPAGSWTVHGLAARKNAMYLELLAEHGVRVFSGTVDLLRRLRAGGVPVALVTASRTACRARSGGVLRDKDLLRNSHSPCPVFRRAVPNVLTGAETDMRRAGAGCKSSSNLCRFAGVPQHTTTSIESTWHLLPTLPAVRARWGFGASSGAPAAEKGDVRCQLGGR